MKGASRLHIGADNIKAHLGTADQPPILHIASHAVASDTTPEQSRIVFSSQARGGSLDEALYLREAYALPLTGVELAVLSACETELGPQVRGEGVQSFSRAFLAAGARSTVSTLWRVADEPTANFMELLYHFLDQGETRAEALRLTKLSFLRSGLDVAHPHYWAPFVLAGDAFQPLPRVVSWWLVGSAVSVAAGLLGLMRRGIRRRDGRP